MSQSWKDDGEIVVWPYAGSAPGLAEAHERARRLAVLITEHGLRDEAAAAIRALQRKKGTHIILAKEVEAVVHDLIRRKAGPR